VSREGVGGGRSTARARGTTELGVREGPLVRPCIRCRERFGECPTWLMPPRQTQPKTATNAYRAAKADLRRPFHALHDKVHLTDVCSGCGGGCGLIAARPALTGRPSSGSSAVAWPGWSTSSRWTSRTGGYRALHLHPATATPRPAARAGSRDGPRHRNSSRRSPRRARFTRHARPKGNKRALRQRTHQLGRVKEPNLATPRRSMPTRVPSAPDEAKVFSGLLERVSSRRKNGVPASVLLKPTPKNDATSRRAERRSRILAQHD
jgi:hypothetical protein